MNRDEAAVGQPSRLSSRASRPRRILGRDAPAAGGTPAPLPRGSWKDSAELSFVRVQRAFGPDNIVREEHLLFHRELRRDASVNLFVSPAPIAQAPVLRTCGARHAHGGVEIAGCVGLE